MIRVLLRACVIVASLTLALSAGAFGGSKDPNVYAKATLDRVMPEVKFDKVPLKDCLDFLRDITDVNLQIQWPTLTAAGVTPETQINVRVRHVTMRKVLSLVLAEAGAAEPLTFFVDDGVVEVTTLAVADSRMITKVYPVQDLLIEEVDYEAPSLNNVGYGFGTSGGNSNSGWSNGNFGGGMWGGGNGGMGGNQNTNSNTSGNNNNGRDLAQSRKDLADKLIELITTVIRPDIWRQNGGNASIVIFQGNMIVTAPRSVHEAIGGPIE